MPQGHILFYDSFKRYGFIRCDDRSPDLYFDPRVLGDYEPSVDETVEYTVGSNRRGPCATSIEHVDRPAAFGVIKSFFTTTGYGWVTGEDGQEYFLHNSSVRNLVNGEYPQAGDKVMFDPMETAKGMAARDCHIILPPKAG